MYKTVNTDKGDRGVILTIMYDTMLYIGNVGKYIRSSETRQSIMMQKRQWLPSMHQRRKIVYEQQVKIIFIFGDF